MGVSLKKLLPLIIQIEDNFSRLYQNAANIDGQYNPQLKTAALVLSRQVRDHADYYRGLQASMDPDLITVDEPVYEAFRSALNDFKGNISRETFNDVSELLEFAVTIQGKSIDMMKMVSKGDISETLKQIVDHLIRNQEQNIETLERFIE